MTAVLLAGLVDLHQVIMPAMGQRPDLAVKSLDGFRVLN